jgi:signal transduction histidine kinase
MPTFPFSRWTSPMAYAICATICAAGIVLFFQHRAISALQAQSRVILRQASEQSAADIAADLRRTLDGPVFDTLTAVNHPELRAGRLDLVATQFAAGLSAYPHVDRFFAWNAEIERATPGQVRFYGRDGAAASDAPLGRAVLDLARRHAGAQQIYVAGEQIAPGLPHQVFLRLFWTDATRIDYFAVLGFVIEPAGMRARLFGPPRRAHLESLLTRRAGGLPLLVTVTDDAGLVLYGTAGRSGDASRVAFPMVFYPADEIHSRLAAGVAPRQWSIAVTVPPAAGVWGRMTEGYGPTLLSVVLLLVAVALTFQAHRRSAELARMQADFVAHVSHQLKTPLSLLSAATETLEMDRVRSPERFAEYLRTIHGEAARLSLLVQRVLEFSRVQQRRNYEFERTDLGALVRETVAAFAHGLSSQQVSFEVEDGDASLAVRADSAALEQVIANLLDNAVKYSDAVKHITIRVRRSGDRAVVEIVDRGVGIAPRDQKHIFERFYRTPGTHRPGFGLGLPIVKELVLAHGGDVTVQSSPGAGSTFRFWLPLDLSPQPIAEAASERARLAS